MCRGCGDRYFETHERPELTEAMKDLAIEIAIADADCKLTYGGLHIVIGDWNLEAEHIEWCLGPDNSHERGLTDQERRIGEALLAMSEPERYAVMDAAESRADLSQHEPRRRGASRPRPA